MDEEAQELLEDDADLRVDLDQRAIAHEQRSHDLQRRDLEREVERRDDHDGPVRPAVTARLLSRAVARVREAAREETHAVASEVLEEDTGDLNLAGALVPALGHHALDEAREVVRHVLLCEQCSRPGAHVPEHHVALGVFHRVVQPRLGAASEPLDKRPEVLCIVLLQEIQVPGKEEVFPDVQSHPPTARRPGFVRGPDSLLSSRRTGPRLRMQLLCPSLRISPAA